MQKRLWLLTVLAFVLMPVSAFGLSNQTLQKMIEESNTRADIVATAKKGVVHIEVEKVIKSPYGRTYFNNPFDLFNDEFFDQFFPELRGRQNQQRAPREFRQKGAGSGCIVTEDGYILTNNHVVGEADKITVRLHDEREFEGEIVGVDPLTDVAVVKIDADNLYALPQGDSDDIRIGETVIAIGNPFGLSNTVTMGIISAKGRSNMDIVDYEDFIQTDAAINPGNSGGPLINLKGEIIGVNTAIFTRSGGYQGIGFAVPMNMAKKVMDQLIEHGKVSRGWLGILLQEITPDLAEALNLDRNKGALIAQVQEGSPADKGGLKRGDVIVGFEGKEIKSADQLQMQVGMTKPDTEVEIEVIRKGERKKLTVTLGSRSEQEIGPSYPTDIGSVIGMSVQNLTPDLAQQYGYRSDMDAVIITAVQPGSPAFNAGLRAGLLVMEVNQKAVSNVKEYEVAMKSANLEKGVLLLIGSRRGAQYIILKANPNNR